MITPEEVMFGKFGGKKKDSRRSFTKTQQAEIIERQKHKCAECGDKIDFRCVNNKI